MREYIDVLEKKLAITEKARIEEVAYWKNMAEIDATRTIQTLEAKIKFLSHENERLNAVIVARCIDMRQNW